MVVHNGYHPLYMSVTPVYIAYPRRSLSGQVKLTLGNKLHDGIIVKVVSCFNAILKHLACTHLMMIQYMVTMGLKNFALVYKIITLINCIERNYCINDFLVCWKYVKTFLYLIMFPQFSSVPHMYSSPFFLIS